MYRTEFQEDEDLIVFLANGAADQAQGGDGARYYRTSVRGNTRVGYSPQAMMKNNLITTCSCGVNGFCQ